VTLYALSKAGLLLSAKSVNDHLEAKKKDIWLNVLPHFHTGGLSQHARAYLSKSKVVDFSHSPWSPDNFIKLLNTHEITLTSLVPTQLYDLVKCKMKIPKSLRAILIGGSKLDEELYFKSRELGYPILPTYGMTEVGSQIATAELSTIKSNFSNNNKTFPHLKILPHVKISNISGCLAVKSDSLFTMKVILDIGTNEQAKEEHRLEIDDQHLSIEVLRRVGDWFVTKDVGEIFNNFISIEGRSDQSIKISGELINLNQLNDLLTKVSNCNVGIILARSEARRGNELYLVLPISYYSDSEKWIRQFNKSVLPVSKIHSVYYVNELPRTELGKIKIQEVKKILGL
jgi:O-succinylbenzoic acid--CoA ligase